MPAAIRGAFDNADVDGDIFIGRNLADAVEVTILNRDGLTDIVSIEFFLQVGFEFRTVGALDPKRITG